MPDTIADTVADQIPGAVEPEGDGSGDAIAALMSSVAFEAQDVQDTLAEFFDFLAERFQSDHWQLSDRQARMLGRPAAQLLNTLWAKLTAYLPDILGDWCEQTPGATAFMLACGMVVAPKVAKQMTLSRARKKSAPGVQATPAQVGPQSIKPATDPTPGPIGPCVVMTGVQ